MSEWIIGLLITASVAASWVVALVIRTRNGSWQPMSPQAVKQLVVVATVGGGAVIVWMATVFAVVWWLATAH